MSRCLQEEKERSSVIESGDRFSQQLQLARANSDLQEADTSLLLVFPELRDSLRDGVSLMTTTNSGIHRMQGANNSQQQQQRHSGVLWKRRDVFKNRWRPRWFSLHPQQGILTYYLLSKPPVVVVSNGMNNEQQRMDGSNMSGVSEDETTAAGLDYDVVPRGTIFLWGNNINKVVVVSNDLLSQPREHLYAFSIRSSGDDNNSTTVVHLAARTAAARAEWVAQISAVVGCQQPQQRQIVRRLHSSPIGDRPGLQRDNMIPRIAETNNDGDEPAAAAAAAAPVWKTVGATTESLNVDLSDEIVEQLNAKIDQYLPLCTEPLDTTAASSDWKCMFHHPNDPSNPSAYQTTTTPHGSLLLVQSHRTLPYTAMQVFSVLADMEHKAGGYETNLQTSERVQVLNPHTWFDVYTYRGVWPTSPREFAVLSHWRTMTSSSTNESAIVYVSFSCPASDAIRPVSSPHVRGQLIVSLVILRAMNNSKQQCRMTRLIAVDLGGGMTSHVSNIVTAQQAGLPGLLEEYIRRKVKPTEVLNDTVVPTNELILSEIIERGVGHACKKRSADTSANDDDDDDTQQAMSVIVTPDDATAMTSTTTDRSELSIAPLEWQAIYLLAPIVLARCCSLFVMGHGVIFCVLLFWCLGRLALWGRNIVVVGSNSTVDSVTCRFTVEPKGIIRFVANHQEEREEIDASVTEVRAVHVVVSALAKALRQRKELRRRRLQIPWLGIDQVLDTSDEPITISVLNNKSGDSDSSNIKTIQGPESLKVRDVAEGMTVSTECGECLVLPMENEQPSAPPIRLDASSCHPNVTIVACVFGLPIPPPGKQQQQQQNNGLQFLKGSSPARQQISVALTVRGADPFACPSLAQEVQKLLQFPEMCDDD